jgi:hypothetical protein
MKSNFLPKYKDGIAIYTYSLPSLPFDNFSIRSFRLKSASDDFV